MLPMAIKGSGIVYVRSRKETLPRLLSTLPMITVLKPIIIMPGCPSDQRSAKQEAWKNNRKVRYYCSYQRLWDGNR
jgi:hypothetical protein